MSNSRISEVCRLGLAILTCLSLGACTTYESQSFKVSKADNVESATIAVDADFSKYDRLQAADMGIYFPANISLSQADQARLRATFRDAFLAELEGYDVSREPGPTTMTVQASLIDLRNSNGTSLPPMSEDISEFASNGSLVFLMEIRDSTSDKVLARAGDSAKSPALATGDGQMTDWKAVEDAAKHWAGLFRTFLDNNLGR
ncbi:MAG: DUF3313 family protein [Woeseiaceae bacterium]